MTESDTSSAEGTRTTSSWAWRGSAAAVSRRSAGVGSVRSAASSTSGRVRPLVVGDVVLGDVAGALVVDERGAVSGEPFLGGDDGVGFGVVGVAFGEQGLGVLGGGAGAGGVGEPDGAGVVELLQLGGTLVEGLGEDRGLGCLLEQPGALGVAGRRVGFGAAQGRGLAVVGGGLVGAGEFVADVAGSPCLFALPRADAHAQLAVGQLVGGLVDLWAVEGSPGGAVGGVLLDLPGLRCGAEGVGLVVVVAAQLAVGRDDAGALLPADRPRGSSGTGPSASTAQEGASPRRRGPARPRAGRRRRRAR